MRSSVNPLTAILIATTTLIGLSACSSDSTSSKATTASSTAATAETDAPETSSPDTAADTTTPDTAADTTMPDTTPETAPVSTDGGVDTTVPSDAADNLKPLLLTAAEVGPDFVEQPFSDPPGTTPCGINVDGQYPSIALTGTQLVQAEPLLALLEEIRVYDSADTAASAYALATAGFACGSTEDGVTLGDPTDISDQVGVTAFGVTVSSADYQGAVILTQINDAIVVFQFQAAQGVDTSSAPDPTALATAGVAKIQQLLGG